MWFASRMDVGGRHSIVRKHVTDNALLQAREVMYL